ncbi:MAG: universal stress protein [Methanomassiliicoccales archaeon]|nr:universal stress protein [Methanomassiliicoccales archaeon]
MNILVGTDGRSAAEVATDYSFRLTKALGATMYIIYVVDKNSKDDKEKRIKTGMRILGRLKIKAAENDVEVTTLLEAGRPQETLVEAAERIGADMIVIGSSEPGKGKSKKSLQNIIKSKANCTVVVVR